MRDPIDLPRTSLTTDIASHVHDSEHRASKCAENQPGEERAKRAVTATGVDRRVRRTRRLLKEALVELIHERGYDRVTVRDIAQRADVGRSTFYAHFESKEDLLFAGTEAYFLSLAEEVSDDLPAAEDARRFRFPVPLLRHVRLQRRFFEASILRGADSRLREISVGILVRLVERELERLGGAEATRFPGATSRESRSGRARAIAGAFMGILDWWLASADHLPPETVDEIFQRVVAGEITAASRTRPRATPSRSGS